MNQQILTDLIRFLCGSSLLWVLYWLLYKGKASYKSQRLLLLLLPMLSLAVLPVRINLQNHTSTTYYEQVSLPADEQIVTDGEHLNTTPVQTVTSLPSLLFYNAIDLLKENLLYLLLGSIYLIGVLFFALKYVTAYRKLRHIQRHSTCEEQEGYKVYRSALIETPFTYWRSVHINYKVSGERLAMITTHEVSHINQLHYLDRALYDLYTILLWFNPFVWLAKGQLMLIHEFEVDQVVVAHHGNRAQYEQFIYDELSADTPPLSYGFNGSQIKNRIMEMRKNFKPSHGTMRTIFTTVVLGVLLLFPTYSYSNEVIVKSPDPVTQKHSMTIKLDGKELNEEQIDSMAELAANALKLTIASTLTPEKVDSLKEMMRAQAQQLKLVVEQSKTEKRRTSTTKSKSTPTQKPKFYDLSEEQYDVIGYNTFMRKEGYKEIYVYDKGSYTQVDILNDISWQREWMIVYPNYAMVDDEHGIQYQVHSIKGGAPFEHFLWVNNQKGNIVTISLIFPPLKKGVKSIRFINDEDTQKKYPGMNASPSSWNYSGVKISKRAPYKRLNRAMEVIRLDKDFKID